jgi:hypothetical protein
VPASGKEKLGAVDVSTTSSGSVLLGKPRLQGFRNVLYAIGLLLMGGGACTGVFCGLAFNDAVQAWGTASNYLTAINRLQGQQPGATLAFAGESLNEAGWRLKHAFAALNARWHELRGFILLSVSIGLALGGCCLCLLAWGLRPRLA